MWDKLIRQANGILIIDAEALGLMGRSYLVGAIAYKRAYAPPEVMDAHYDQGLVRPTWDQVDSMLVGVDPTPWSGQPWCHPDDLQWARDNVLCHVPDRFMVSSAVRDPNPLWDPCWRRVLDRLARTVIHYQESGWLIAADCPFPVETNLLAETLHWYAGETTKTGYHLNKRIMEVSPYPLLDVSSVLMACGHPFGADLGIINDAPHDPLKDAQTSFRRMVKALGHSVFERRLVTEPKPED